MTKNLVQAKRLDQSIRDLKEIMKKSPSKSTLIALKQLQRKKTGESH